MDEKLFTITKHGRMMILGIGRLYTPEEKKIIRSVAKIAGFNIPTNCNAGLYTRQ